MSGEAAELEGDGDDEADHHDVKAADCKDVNGSAVFEVRHDIASSGGFLTEEHGEDDI